MDLQGATAGEGTVSCEYYKPYKYFPPPVRSREGCPESQNLRVGRTIGMVSKVGISNGGTLYGYQILLIEKL